MAKYERYEKQDTTLVSVVGAFAIITVNVLDYFGLLSIFFASDRETALQILTVLFTAIGIGLLSYLHRKKKEKMFSNVENETNEVNEANECVTKEEKPKNLKEKLNVVSICDFHLHIPQISV